MFEWFKKRSDTNFEEKLSKVNDHVRASFGLVKKDISEMAVWLKEMHESHLEHHTKVTHHEKRLLELERKLEGIYQLLEERQEPEEQEVEEITDFDFNQVANSFTNLRTTEKEVFQKLSKLFRERGRNVHLKDLAAEVYPGKDYEKVRTALANHITALEIFDFVYRQRIGREVYIGFTEKGQKFLKQVDKEMKKGSKKVVSKVKVR